MLAACMTALFDLGAAAKGLGVQIAGFSRSQAEARERYMAAGLNADEIAVIGIKPTELDLEDWKRKLKKIQAREEQINAFLQSAPDYDLALLGAAAARV
ncbi:hypothetical protein D9M69_633130 [compost metagenome]